MFRFLILSFFSYLFLLSAGKKKSLTVENIDILTDRKKILSLLKSKELKENIHELLVFKLLFFCNVKDLPEITRAIDSKYPNVRIAGIEWIRLCSNKNDSYLNNLYVRLLNKEKDTSVLIYTLDALNQSNHPKKIKILNHFLRKIKGKNSILEQWIINLLKK